MPRRNTEAQRQILSANIYRLRLENAMTQFDLAVATGSGLSSITNWENGKHFPQPRMLAHLARALNVEIADLLEGGADAVPDDHSAGREIESNVEGV